MAFKLIQNTFDKGLNKDIDDRFQAENNYKAAENISITGKDNHLSAKNIRGSKEVSEILSSSSSDLNILGAFECKGLYKSGTYPFQTSDEKNKSLLLMSYDSGVSTIHLYDQIRDSLHVMLSTSGVDQLNFPALGTVEAEVFGEGNVSNVYFVDFENEPRQIETVIDLSNPITDADQLANIPLAPVDKLTFQSVELGGSLQSGSYSIAYQYVNIDTGKRTTFSLLSMPIPIYPPDLETATSEEIFGGVPGELTPKRIRLTLDLKPDNAQFYNAISLGIVKYIDGSKEPPTIAYRTNPSISMYDNPSEIFYDGTAIETQIGLEEIVVEDAPIKTFKTLRSKDNVLFGGNVKYNDLEVDSITFDSASTLKQDIGVSGDILSTETENSNNPIILFSLYNASMPPDDQGDFKRIWLAHENVQIPFKSTNGITCAAWSNSDGPQTSALSVFIHNDVEPGNKFTIVVKIAYLATIRCGVLAQDDNGKYGYNPWSSSGADLKDYTYTAVQGDTAASVAYNIGTALGELEAANPNVMSHSVVDSQITIKNITPADTGSYHGTFNWRRDLLEFRIKTEKGTSTSVEDLEFLGDSNGGYQNENNVVNTKGHFRDEVYRYGVTYMNEFGSWSPPVAFDFSDYNARNETGKTWLIQSINDNPASPNATDRIGVTRLVIPFTQATEFEQGGYLTIKGSASMDGTHLIIQAVQNGSFSSVDIEGSFDSVSPYGTGYETLGSQYSHSDKGSDWKYPPRKNSNYTLFSNQGNNNNTAALTSLGLRVQGITNHPSWAKAMAIVRVRRIKDIIHQSPHIPVVAAQPSLNLTGAPTPPEGASEVGTFGPKKHAQGAARNLLRSSSIDTGGLDESKYTLQSDTSEDSTAIPASFIMPPEYMYNYNGTSFGDFSFYKGSKVRIVDAASFLMTTPFDIDQSGVDDGTNKGDELALAFRADNKFNYFYQRATAKGSLNFYENLTGLFPAEGESGIIDVGELIYKGSPYSFPTAPRSATPIMRRLTTFSDYESISLYNSGNPVETQRGLILYLEDRFGDLSFYSAQNGTTPPTGRGITKDIQFNENTFASDRNKYNVHADNYITGNYDNSIIDDSDGAAFTTPILNITRGLEDDRYGKIDEVHEYIFTGIYEEITSPTQKFTVDIFGGDCFITKTNLKVSDSTLGTFDVGGERNVRGYPDFIEVLSLYVESTVNTNLKSDQFTYPTVDDKTIFEFQNKFSYDYNFGYSSENEPKVFLSRDNSDDNRLDYPARFVYSDQKIFQGDIEGFNRFRALGFYDLEETYGGITAFRKLRDDNLYSIQEEGVSTIPINKQIIEDAVGGLLAINSSSLINSPQYILNKNGSQHVRTVVVTDDHIIFTDSRQKEVVKVGGKGDGKISSVGMYSFFQEKLDSNITIPEKDLFAGYDFNNEEYVLAMNPFIDTEYNNGNAWNEIPLAGFVAIWSDKLDVWTTELNLGAAVPLYFRHSDKNFYIVGSDISGRVKLEEMYNGSEHGVILGERNESYIDFVINPDGSQGKKFDVFRIDSNERLTSAIVTVFKEDGVVDSVSQFMDLDIKPRSDGYEIPVKLDQNGQRLNGKYAVVRLFIDNAPGSQEIVINNVLTKYRLTGRQFR